MLCFIRCSASNNSDKSYNVQHPKHSTSVELAIEEIEGNTERVECPEEGMRRGIALDERDGFDEGYCWVILLCGAILQLMSGGVTLSSGMIVEEIRDTFEESPVLASLIGALNCGLAYGSGNFTKLLPFTSLNLQKGNFVLQFANEKNKLG